MNSKDPDNWSRDDLLAKYVFGVWTFLIVAGVAAASLAIFLIYELL